MSTPGPAGAGTGAAGATWQPAQAGAAVWQPPQVEAAWQPHEGA
ncbi:MAG TPA: hypothetical protein VFE24_12745 [Pirellulales bacterium]|nr:hypothetical protein [Pirellulales bacterium]